MSDDKQRQMLSDLVLGGQRKPVAVRDLVPVLIAVIEAQAASNVAMEDIIFNIANHRTRSMTVTEAVQAMRESRAALNRAVDELKGLSDRLAS